MFEKVAVGPKGVVAITKLHQIYKYNKRKKFWQRISGQSLKDISAGKSSVWGVNNLNKVYKYVSFGHYGDWVQTKGSLTQVTMSAFNKQKLKVSCSTHM